MIGIGYIFIATLVLLILAIPGYIARTSYHTKQLTQALLPKRLIDDLLLSAVFSFPLHFVTGVIVWAINSFYPSVPKVNLQIILRLITGKFEKDGKLSDTFIGIINNIEDNLFPWVICYGALVLVVGATAGWVFRNIVWYGKLDLRLPYLFKFGNYWLYRSTGRGMMKAGPWSIKGILSLIRRMDKVKKKKPQIWKRFFKRRRIVPVVDALVELDGKIQIYTGIWWDFIVDEKGELVDLILFEPERVIREEKMVAGKYTVNYNSEDIEGGFLVVRYSQVVNLNVSYYNLNLEPWPLMGDLTTVSLNLLP